MTEIARETTELAPADGDLDESWGYQMILDCFGCSEEMCCDLEKGYEFLDQICAFLKMTKQTQPYIFKTCERAFPGRPGYSGWIPIIESGIQIHTSAKNRFISIDVYSCKKFSRAMVEEFVRDWFRPKVIDTEFVYRGRAFRRRAFHSEWRADAAPQHEANA